MERREPRVVPSNVKDAEVVELPLAAMTTWSMASDVEATKGVERVMVPVPEA
jgi:hypothetical protein